MFTLIIQDDGQGMVVGSDGKQRHVTVLRSSFGNSEVIAVMNGANPTAQQLPLPVVQEAAPQPVLPTAAPSRYKVKRHHRMPGRVQINQKFSDDLRVAASRFKMSQEQLCDLCELSARHVISHAISHPTYQMLPDDYQKLSNMIAQTLRPEKEVTT